MHFTNYTVKEGLSDNYIKNTFEDKSGNIWFGSDGGGAMKFKFGSFEHFNIEGDEGFNMVLTAEEDKSGNTWIGTFGGGV